MVWNAHLQLAYGFDQGRTVPTLRRHEGPLRVQKGFTPEGEAVWHQIVVHPPGGIAGGDHLHIEVEAEARAHALLTSPGAAKWYRSSGTDRPARQNLHLLAREHATIEWLPMETLFFSATQARLETRIDLHPTARLMALEVCCLGRPSAGERFDQGEVSVLTRIFRAEDLVFQESAQIDPLRSRAMAGLAGHAAWGSLICAAPNLEQSLARFDYRAWQAEIKSHGLAATSLGNVLVVRWLGARADQGMLRLREAWAYLRPVLIERAAVRPRIWAT
jgi:urease accessory protein